LFWAPENFNTVQQAQLATEIWKISFTKSVAGPREFFLGYQNCYFRELSWELKQQKQVLSLKNLKFARGSGYIVGHYCATYYFQFILDYKEKKKIPLVLCLTTM
jgi:hypothetical protein